MHQGNVGNPDDCRRDDPGGHRPARPARHPRQQRRHHRRQAGAEDERRGLAQGPRVNLSGAFYLSKPALEHMVERGSGRIINISSIIGQNGNIGQANYAASKSGLFGLTMTLAQRGRLRAEEGRASSRATALGAHRQRGRAGLHRDRHGRDRAREGARRHPRPGPARRGSASPDEIARVVALPRAPTTRPTSPARSGPSTAAWTCRRTVPERGEGRRAGERVTALYPACDRRGGGGRSGGGVYGLGGTGGGVFCGYAYSPPRPTVRYGLPAKRGVDTRTPRARSR